MACRCLAVLPVHAIIFHPKLYTRRCAIRCARYEAERSSAKAVLPGTSLARFAWTLDWALGTEHSITELRLHDAKERGVPLPPDWVTALHSFKAGEICRNFVGDLQLPTGISNVSCSFLGAPKVCTPYVQNRGAGKCHAFSHLGGRKNFVLVAHVEDHEWLCHGGSRARMGAAPGRRNDR